MIKYRLNYDYSSMYVNEIGMMNMFNNFPNTNALNCLLLFLAMSLCGINNTELLIMLQSLDNKNAIINLMKKTFEKYCYYSNNIKLNENMNEILSLQFAKIIIIDSEKNITRDDISQLVKNKVVKVTSNENVKFNANIIYIHKKI